MTIVQVSGASGRLITAFQPNKQTLTIKAYVDAPANNTVPQPHTNIAEVTKVDEHDPDPLNNIGEATETPKYADLLVEKNHHRFQPNVGDTFFIYGYLVKSWFGYRNEC